MRGKIFPLIILMLIIITAHNIHLTKTSNVATEDEPLNGIHSPRIGFPQFVLPNETLMIEVVGNASGPWSATLVSELRSNNLTFLNSTYNATKGITSLTFKVVGDAKPGFYDLIISCDGGKVLREPNCVVVREAFSLPLKILWYTDPHINFYTERMINTWKLITLANFIDPDLIIITGDIVDGGREEYFKTAYDYFLKLESPILLVPGNHDHVKGRELFLKYFGLSNRSLDIGSTHLISLDSGTGSMIGRFYGDQIRWLEGDLNQSQDSLVKILMFHHPLLNGWKRGIENRTDANASMVCDLVQRYNVTLLLHGHTHVTYPPKTYPTLTLTDSCAFPGGDPYSSFRIISVLPNGSIDYHYAGTSDPMEILKFSVIPYHENDGSTYGGAVKVKNHLRTSLNGTLTFRVKYGEELTVENAKIKGIWNLTSYQLVETVLHLKVDEERLVKVYTKADTEPPKIEEVNFDTESGIVTIINLNATIRDDVIGVERAQLKYSTENETWETKPLAALSPSLFLTKIQLENSVKKVYYYIEAWDVNGLKAVSPVSELQLEEEGDGEERKSLFNLIPPWLIATVTVLIVMALSLTFFFKEKEGCHPSTI